MPIVRPEGHVRTQSELEGWPVGIVSFKLGERWICHVDNVSPGAIIARSDGPTREDAVSSALAIARQRLQTTRRLKNTLADLRDSVARLEALRKSRDDDDEDR
jgi:hypothetical protein